MVFFLSDCRGGEDPPKTTMGGKGLFLRGNNYRVKKNENPRKALFLKPQEAQVYSAKVRKGSKITRVGRSRDWWGEPVSMKLQGM